MTKGGKWAGGVLVLLIIAAISYLAGQNRAQNFRIVEIGGELQRHQMMSMAVSLRLMADSEERDEKLLEEIDALSEYLNSFINHRRYSSYVGPAFRTGPSGTLTDPC